MTPGVSFGLFEESMPHLVNLDALIRREDFEVALDRRVQSLDEADKLKIVELEADSLMYKLIRKPDFQRTTAHWSPVKVANFIESFLAGDLIPALILWQSNASGSIFVIDGAHRLSALIAWVHDDYGDRNISQLFFEGYIPPEQKQAADETRNIIATRIGSYTEIKHALNPSPERARFAGTLAASGVTLQWVRGDATRAEKSFHTINTEQTPIGDLEVRLIRDRRCANAIAARALVSAGTGQYSRSSFTEQNKGQIRTLAKSIYDDLFVPPLETPIKTLDLPVAGRSYSFDSFKLILDVIEFLNQPATENGKKSKAKKLPKKSDILTPTMEADADGSATVTFLTNFKRVSSQIAGNSSGSLGLHPAVYFYSATGAYQPTAFLAAIGFVQDMARQQEFIAFTEHRYAFEELLLKYKHFINEIARKYGSGHRGLAALSKLFRYLFEGVKTGHTEVEIVPVLIEDERLKFLKPIIDVDKGTKTKFPSERKSAVFLKQALDKALRCEICKARVHKNSMNIDHILRREDGGNANVENGQVTHPYCNHGYKEWLHAKQLREQQNR